MIASVEVQNQTFSPVVIMNHLPTSILNLLGFTSGGRRQGKRVDRDEEDEEGEGDMTSMVKRLVMEQHRTMFYTVTLSPQSQRKSIIQANNIAPSLKVKVIKSENDYSKPCT